jgi:hypothetical protein
VKINEHEDCIDSISLDSSGGGKTIIYTQSLARLSTSGHSILLDKQQQRCT